MARAQDDDSRYGGKGRLETLGRQNGWSNSVLSSLAFHLQHEVTCSLQIQAGAVLKSGKSIGHKPPRGWCVLPLIWTLLCSAHPDRLQVMTFLFILLSLLARPVQFS